MQDIFNSILYFWDKNIVGSKTYYIGVLSIDLISQVWIYLLVGVFLTTVLYYLLPQEKIANFFKNNSHSSIILAALIGVVSPFGLRSLIPLMAALLFIGIPVPPLVAFMLSSPLINPNLFLLTIGSLGLEISILRVLSAFFLGIAGGSIFLFLNRYNIIDLNNILIEKHKDKFALDNKEIPDYWLEKIQAIFIEYLQFLRFVGKYFLIAVVLAATIKTFLPTGLIYDIFGKNKFFSVIISTFVGIPLYICGGAAIPMVQQLFSLGMSKGAVLAFFIAGPATKISSLLVMKSILKLSFVITYILITLSGAILFGLIYNFM